MLITLYINTITFPSILLSFYHPASSKHSYEFLAELMIFLEDSQESLDAVGLYIVMKKVLLFHYVLTVIRLECTGSVQVFFDASGFS